MAEDKDQDKLAEEWANALTQDESADPGASGGDSPEDALADEWAKALATQEVDGVKKEKDQAYLRTQTHEPEFRDMTAEHKAQRQNPGTKRDLDFILDIPLEVSAELGRTKLLINEL
ncbi:MAG: flagellar motor switch protein FliN, partial [Desulfovibrio sp.]|nr:flagellar motor switch protein FliN [Desulfovibrio sp.]